VKDKSLESLFRLDGKVIVITGAAGLLGRKHAEAVAEFGAIPVILDLSQKNATNVAARLKEEYKVESEGFAVDITSEEQINLCCKKLIKKFGKIDVLINNAANNPKVEDSKEGKNFSRLENFELDIWNHDIAVGLTGAFLCSKHFGFAISQNSGGGSIINISSDLGVIAPDQRLYRKEGVPDNEQNVKPVTYSVVKSGLIGLTRYLATYWAEKNVRCNALCPGGVHNNQNSKFLKEVCSRIPMGRMARVDEYQGAILFLCSEASSYMNGAILNMDGGRSVW
jgi:NAD(P)-dependent dehydrogenase (short-subunit alcohol dehydrogenase family)